MNRRDVAARDIGTPAFLDDAAVQVLSRSLADLALRRMPFGFHALMALA
jgi:hypothetical protein